MQLRIPQQQGTQRYVVRKGTAKGTTRAKLPCFLCGTGLDIRTDKNGKRYFICDECGVQAFIRREAGLSRLATLVSQLKKQKPNANSGQMSPVGFSAVVTEIDELKKQIKKLKAKGGLFSDRGNKRLRKTLENRVNALLSMLEKEAKNVQPIAKTKNIS